VILDFQLGNLFFVRVTRDLENGHLKTHDIFVAHFGYLHDGPVSTLHWTHSKYRSSFFTVVFHGMAASFLNQIFNSDSSSRRYNGTHCTRQGLDTPPPSPATSQHTYSTSPSRSNSPSRVQRTTILTSMGSPEHFTSSSAAPVDKLLSESEVPRYKASCIKTSGKSKQESELPTTSKTTDCGRTTFHQPFTRHFCPNLVLQNTGSVARDHLASERTFLAYVRTSLGLASAGVALVQLFTMSGLASGSSGVPLPAANQRLQKFATPLGLSALGMALIVLLIGERS